MSEEKRRGVTEETARRHLGRTVEIDYLINKFEMSSIGKINFVSPISLILLAKDNSNRDHRIIIHLKNVISIKERGNHKEI